MTPWYNEIPNGPRDFITLERGKKTKIRVAKIYMDNNPKFQPTKRDRTPQGWAIVIEDEEGKKLTVSSFALQHEIIDLKVDNGDYIEIYRGQANGDYRVTKLSSDKDAKTPL